MSPRRVFRRSPLDLPVLVFLASAILGLWVSFDPSLSWSLLLALIGSLALYTVITRSSVSARIGYASAWFLLFIQICLALYFITQYEHLDYPTKMGFVNRLGRLTGTLLPPFASFHPHPNALAAFIVGGIPLAIGLLLSTRHRRKRLLAGLSLLVLSYGLLLTASRGAWVALAACVSLTLIAWIGCQLPRRGQIIGLIGLVIIVLILGAGLASIAPDRVPGLSSALSRGEDRTELYLNSLHLIRDYPFTGIGLGDTFGLVYSKYILLIPHVFLTYAHNLPLSIWLNQGLLGLLSFVWILIIFSKLALDQAMESNWDPLFWGSTLGFAAMLLHGLTDSPQYSDSHWVMPVFFVLLGLSIAAVPSRATNAGSRSHMRRRVVSIAALITVLVAVAGILLADVFYANLGAIQQTRAELGLDLHEATRQQMLDAAARHFQQALARNGGQPVAHWRLGLLALNSDHFPEAIAHLTRAYSALPGHRGIQKALGYAYLWDGQIGQAEIFLDPLDEVPQELGTWSWWRGTQGQDELSEYARQLRSRLSQEP